MFFRPTLPLLPTFYFSTKLLLQKNLVYRVDISEGYKHFSKSKPMKFEHFSACKEWWNNSRFIKDSDTETFKAKDFSVAEIIERSFDLDLCG